MKKEIMALIESAEGSYRLNNIATLRRWTEGGKGKCDMLVIAFDPINGVNFGDDTMQIYARSYDGIIAECVLAIARHMRDVSDTLNKNLVNGYRNVQ